MATEQVLPVNGQSSVTQKYDLITRNLVEVIGKDELQKILAERDLILYWGTAPTGKPHIAYFVPLTKIADFLKAGCKVKILFADIHAQLDSGKSSEELVDYRTEYYSNIIKLTLTSLSVPISQLEFVKGSEYQKSASYMTDYFNLAKKTSEAECRKAGTEVVKQSDNPLLSSLMYPPMQALDEEHLGVDCQFGGVDQRKIFMLAREILPRIGYRKRIHLMNEMMPGLTGTKMSSSDPNSKIDLLDDAKTVEKKIKKAFCEEGLVKDNGLLGFVKCVLFPFQSLNGSPSIKFVRKPEFGGDIEYTDYQSLEDAYAAKDLHPGDLKKGVAAAINALLDPIRTAWSQDPKLTELTELAYPTAPAAPKTSKVSKAQSTPRQ